MKTEHVENLIIGGGQAGLSVGYHLAKRGVPFRIVDADERTGDQWRRRWDSLRLFTPAKFSGLDGMRFPAHRDHFPTKDEMADYLEAYAARFELPIDHGVEVTGLSAKGDGYVATTNGKRYEADNVVVAMGTFQRPKVPAFAKDLDRDIVQLHSIEYRDPSQLRDGGVLIVGAGNSGADIAMELAPHHDTWMSGRDTGHVPFRIESFVAQRILVRFVIKFLFHRVLTVRTPIGRKARPKIISSGGPLVRVKPKDLTAAGVHRVGRTAGVQDGLPVLDDGTVLDVRNVIWCTGFHPGFDWIDLPIHGEHEPRHERGLVPAYPGLHFVGLHFLYSLSSEQIHGVGRDAERIAKAVARRSVSSSDSGRGRRSPTTTAA